MATEPTRRRQRRATGGRRCQVLVRFTDEDYGEVAGKADARGLSVPRFLAEVGLGAPPVNRTVVATELIGVRAQVRKIGGHTNQLAHAANVGHEANARDLAEAIAALSELTDRWLDVLDRHLSELH